MAYNFPDSPTVGQVFEKWTWDGVAWVLTTPSESYSKAESDARYVNIPGDTMSGTLTVHIPSAGDHLRLSNSKYGWVWHTNTAAAYMMVTNVDDPLGQWNGLRPFMLDFATGNISMYHSVMVGGTLNVGGAVSITSDVNVQRSWAPTTGYMFLGNSGARYVGYDGSNYIFNGAHAYAANGRLWGNTDFSAPLPLAGGQMTGLISTAGGGELNAGGNATSIMIQSTPGSGWAPMAFHVAAGFGTNFGLNINGNFYMGGWSHGGAYYKFWTTRDFNYTPQPNLGFVPVEQNGGAYMAGNKVYIGWDGGGTRIQIDASDQGRIAMQSALPSYLSNGRLPYAGDTPVVKDVGYIDMIANALLSGSWYVTHPNGSAMGGQLNGFRCRHVQGYTTGWFTFAFA